MDLSSYSGRTLAFLGDAVWSLEVRNSLLIDGQGQGKILQKKSISYVSAKAQAQFYEQLHQEGFFSDEEENWVEIIMADPLRRTRMCRLTVCRPVLKLF